MDTSTINFYKGNHKYEVSADELATEIAQCLQIENLNFLIGAGCSSYRDDTGAEKAIPTMAGLAREFYDCNPDLKVDRKNAAKDLFPNNLEALINYLISLKNITTSEKSRKALSGKISIINKFIFERVCNTPYSKELIQLYKEFYLRIVKKTRQVPVNIFTTNYDLYSENALDELGIMYNNGFLGSAQRIFNPNSYNYVVVENLGLSRDVWKSVSNFINLYKIHGSINWLKDDNSGSDTPHILEKDIELIRSRKKYDSIIGVSQLLNIDISNLDDTATEVVTKVFSKMLFDYLRALSPRNSMPINLILEEAHRFVRSDMDYGVLGYNIFERIAKEGRKFGLLMGISSQRPSELSKTVVSQCNNFIIHKIQNPDDIQYISRMVPYMNQGMVDRITYLRRGYALVFGTAINLPTLTAFEKASPSPNSGNSNIVEKWYVD